MTSLYELVFDAHAGSPFLRHPYRITTSRLRAVSLFLFPPLPYLVDKRSESYLSYLHADRHFPRIQHPSQPQTCVHQLNNDTVYAE